MSRARDGLRRLRHPRHPRRVGICLLALAVVLALDLATGIVAQHRVQAAVERALPRAQVSTRVGGWPVALHLARDQLGSVTLDASGVRLPGPGRDIDVASLHATAHGVHGVHSGHRFRLDKVRGRAHLTWAELSRQTGADLAEDAKGNVVVRGSVPVLGEQVQGRLTGRMTLDVESQQVHVDDPVASLDGVAVPPDVITGLVARLSNRFSLPTVPGLTWTSVTAEQQGVVLTFTGSGLVFGG